MGEEPILVELKRSFVHVLLSVPNGPGERRPTGVDRRQGEEPVLWADRSTGLLGCLADPYSTRSWVHEQETGLSCEIHVDRDRPAFHAGPMRFARCKQNCLASLHQLLALCDVDHFTLQHHVELCLLL